MADNERYHKALVAFLRWTKAEQPAVYARIVEGLQEQGVQLSSLGWVDVVANVLKIAKGATDVYGSVKGAQDSHKLMKANIARLKAGEVPATSLYAANAAPTPSSPPPARWPSWALPVGALIVLVPIGVLAWRRRRR